MSRKSGSRLVFFALSVMLVSPLLLGGLAGARAEEEGKDDFYRYLSVFTDALKLVRTVYVEPTDLRVLMAGALDGATDALDPFSVYVPAEQVAAYRRVQSVGRRHSGLFVLTDRGVAFAVAVDKGSPAERAGMEPGDIVSKIDGLSTREMPLWQIQRTLAGDPGTKVTLELIRRGEVVRSELELGTYSAPEPSLEVEDGVAVLRIPIIDATTQDKVEKLLAGAEPQPLLVDLRGAAGDDPSFAYPLADLFVDGDLGKLFDRGEVVETFVGSRPNIWDARPVTVLVDQGSQGASEVLAEVLHELADGLIVGERTFGHAGRTSQVNLTSGGLLQVTDAFYSGPNGEQIDQRLEPDELLVTDNSLDGRPDKENGPGLIGEEASPAADAAATDKETPDPMLEKAIELARAPRAAEAA